MYEIETDSDYYGYKFNPYRDDPLFVVEPDEYDFWSNHVDADEVRQHWRSMLEIPYQHKYIERITLSEAKQRGLTLL
jgi:hypothetical protein